MQDIWIVLGNTNSWGRDHTLKLALGNMLKEAGMNRAPTECMIYRWTDVPDESTKLYWVDDMGGVTFPTGHPPTKLHVSDATQLKKLHTAYFAFLDAADDFEWSPTVEKVFG